MIIEKGTDHAKFKLDDGSVWIINEEPVGDGATALRITLVHGRENRDALLAVFPQASSNCVHVQAARQGNRKIKMPPERVDRTRYDDRDDLPF